MRIVSDCLLAAWSVLNLVLAVAARRVFLVAAVFAGAAALLGAGLLISSPAVVTAGLAASIVAPVLYGQRIAVHGAPSRVTAERARDQLAAIDAVLRDRQAEIRAARRLIRTWDTELEDWLAAEAY
jgi:hypothetical protein